MALLEAFPAFRVLSLEDALASLSE